MRTTLMLLLALATPVVAGEQPAAPTHAPRSETKADLDRPTKKPGDAPSVCTYVDVDPNAPSGRADCIAGRDPAPQRPVEKSPPGAPGNDATPSAR